MTKPKGKTGTEKALALFIVIARYVFSYENSSGEKIEETRVTRINGKVDVKDGGSAFLGFVDLVMTLAGAPFCVTGLVAGIRRDGTCYLAPKGRDDDGTSNRQESWIARDGSNRPGKRWYEAPGFDAQENFFNAVADQLPELRKREKQARAALAKRAA